MIGQNWVAQAGGGSREAGETPEGPAATTAVCRGPAEASHGANARIPLELLLSVQETPNTLSHLAVPLFECDICGGFSGRFLFLFLFFVFCNPEDGTQGLARAE